MIHKTLVEFLLVTALHSTLSNDTLPNGNFGHFGPCVIKFVRLKDTLEYVDLTEQLIHANNPTTLIFTVSGKPKFYHPDIHDSMNTLDFKFYEVCTITVFVSFNKKDNNFRLLYLNNTRDVLMEQEDSTLVIISKYSPKQVFKLTCPDDCSVQSKTLVLRLKRYFDFPNSIQSAKIEWFFICPYCKNSFRYIHYTHKVKQLTVAMFQNKWGSKQKIGVYLGYTAKKVAICGKGQYYIAPDRRNCYAHDTLYITVSKILNVTFDHISIKQFQSKPWGFFEQGYLKATSSSMRYTYSQIKSFHLAEYAGSDALYCNFNVWSENSDLAEWASPFSIGVWLVGFVTVVATVLFVTLKDIYQFKKDTVAYEILSRFGTQFFIICVKFRSFMLPSQYELYLTANLVVPPRYKVLRTLSEFFDNNYTLVYDSREIANYTSTRSRLVDEFLRKSLREFPHGKTIVTWPYWNNLTKYVRKRSPRNVILIDDKALSFRGFLWLQKRWLKGKYDCFVVSDISLVKAIFYRVQNMLRVEIVESIKGLEMGGFRNLWFRQFKHYRKMRAMNWPSSKPPSPYISINTLKPFFKTLALTVVLFGVIFTGEVITNAGMRGRLCRKIRDFGGFVNPSARRGFYSREISKPDVDSDAFVAQMASEEHVLRMQILKRKLEVEDAKLNLIKRRMELVEIDSKNLSN
ncbi:Monofunctional isopimaradiene synthase, chloroplastic [Folsomia candida]|uniref:Monofunctional isopimaradiene synthase, chloroplastic n=1 Tax=Folsomia candida TaxID=158441 RepID=A0A226DDU9_FOLCA|nr:Monofunctional isopimaradiene synthase, chloroplastic [Folsomia candida]